MRSDTTPTAGSRRGDGLLTRLTVADLMPWPAYRAARHARRQGLIEHRRERSVTLGPFMRLQFEDALTIRHQIQEVLHIERSAGLDAMQHEIDTYAPLLPDGTNWKATLMIELPDAAQRRRELPALSEAAHHVYVDIAGLPRSIAHANEDQADRHLGRPSGVHFLRFQLPPGARCALLSGAAANLGCAHERYAFRHGIAATTIERLCGDLAPPLSASAPSAAAPAAPMN